MLQQNHSKSAPESGKYGFGANNILIQQVRSRQIALRIYRFRRFIRFNARRMADELIMDTGKYIELETPDHAAKKKKYSYIVSELNVSFGVSKRWLRRGEGLIFDFHAPLVPGYLIFIANFILGNAPDLKEMECIARTDFFHQRFENFMKGQEYSIMELKDKLREYTGEMENFGEDDVVMEARVNKGQGPHTVTCFKEPGSVLPG